MRLSIEGVPSVRFIRQRARQGRLPESTFPILPLFRFTENAEDVTTCKIAIRSIRFICRERCIFVTIGFDSTFEYMTTEDKIRKLKRKQRIQLAVLLLWWLGCLSYVLFYKKEPATPGFIPINILIGVVIVLLAIVGWVKRKRLAQQKDSDPTL